MKKEWWQQKRQQWKGAITAIARKHGQNSNIYKALGSAAWGRTPYEGSSLEAAIGETAYLEGVRAALLSAGELYNMPGTDDLRRIHDRIREAT